MSNYYNEHDPKAAAWLRELIKAGLIPDGDVDERSITEINANELYPYTQCHFFAGIGGWSLALQLAGVSATTRLWTGSCPCQPFSSAGKGLAQADERHLWPTFFDLIKECRPDTVFGEQVASAIGHGWLDGIQADLESENYACGAAVLGAHSVGAPHIRQRLYWVADSEGIRLQEHGECELRGAPWEQSETSGLADSELCRRERIKVEQCTGILKTMDGKEEPQFAISPHSASFRRLADSDSGRFQQRDEGIGSVSVANQNGADNRLVQPNSDRCEQRDIASTSTGHRHSAESAGSWDDYQLAHCRDGKSRRIPTEPAFQPLAHGIPARVVRLRGYGNAIVPQVASEFVKAFISTLENTPTNE